MRKCGDRTYFTLGLCLVSICWGQAAFGQSLVGEISRAISRGVEADLTRPTLKVRNGSGAIMHMRLSHGDTFLSLVLADRSVRVWDLKLGIQRPVIRLNGRPRIAVPGPLGKNVVVGFENGDLLVFDHITGTLRGTLRGHKAEVVAVDISPDGKILVSGGRDGSVHIWDLDRNRRIASISGHRKAITSIAVSADGERVVTASEDRSIRLWDGRTGAPMHVYGGVSGKIGKVKILRDGATILIASRTGSGKILNLETGAVIKKFKIGKRKASTIAFDDEGRFAVVGFSGRKIRLIDIRSSKTTRKFEGPDGAVDHLAFDSSNQRVISGGRDGQVRIWDAGSGEVLVQVVSTTNGWAVIDNQGRFDGSEQGMKDVGWGVRGQDMTLGSFAERLFEPGLLATHLSGGDDFITRVSVDITQGMALPPKVEIDLPHSHREAGRPFNVIVIATDQGGGIDTLRLYHNGKLVQPGSFLQQRNVEADGKRLRVAAFQVNPVAGLNTFRAFATGVWPGEGESERVSVTFSGQNTTSKLHIVAVGINRYANPELDLTYAVPDAKAIIQRLEEASGGIFTEVVVHRLFDERATKSNILELLDAMRDTRPEDVVVVYFAGHGIALDDDWLLMAHEWRGPSDRSSYRKVAVTAKQIQDALVAANAQRVLVMIDSCRSGVGVDAFRKFKNFQRRYLREFSRVAGVTVLAATRRDQDAAEAETLGNGLFTHIVLEGLGGDADKTPRDGNVTAHEIVGFSASEMPAHWRDLARQYQNIDPLDPQAPEAFALGADFTLTKRLN